MTTSRITLAMALARDVPDATFIQRLARRAMLAKLGGITHGRLEVHEGGHHLVFGTLTPAFPDPVVVRVRSPEFYADLAFDGSIGAGESYMLGLWDCDNLVDLVRLMIANRGVLDALEGGTAWLKRPLHKLFHHLHRNTVKGSRRNIHAHYDLGNDFFRLFLDDTLMYSAAVFETPEMGLQEASIAKLDRICRKLELTPDDHLLEIGTGWGGLAIHAASRYGCRVTTTTISDAQYQLADERIRAAGLENRITLLKEDFRNLRGQFDKVVSVEMIEAIGEANIGAFFEVCGRCLKPEGRLLVQAITIADQLFDGYRKSVDFIQRFIFPGGFLPSLTLLCEQAGKRSGLRVFHLEDIGPHYATTLQHWRENFHANYQALVDLGHSREFLRLWDFYFCYCEGGFRERTTGDMQILYVNSGDRSQPLLAL